jgi:hypothetical protein
VRGVGRRGGRRPLLLLDGAVVNLGREPLEDVVHRSLHRMRGTIVIVQTTVIVIVMNASLYVGSGRTTLGRVSTSFVAVQRERRDARRREHVARRL